MKLNLLKCLKVYQAIQDVENEKMGFSTAHTLIMAKKQLEPHVEFYSAQEKEIVEKYALRDEHGGCFSTNGSFRLPNERVPAYNADKAELNGVEVELDLKSVRLKSIPNVKPSTLEALMEIFDISEGDPV